MMMNGFDGWGWVGGVLMAVGMVAFWAFVITAIVLLIRYLTTSRSTAASPAPNSGQVSAEEVLAQRLARGEIDEQEYRQRLALLRERQ